MTEWRQSTWGDEVSLEYGKGLRDYTNSLGPVRVYGSNGAIGYTDRELSKGPGVILGRKGAYRGVEYSKGPFFVIDTAYYVVPKTELDMRWLYYAIKHYKLGEIDDGSPIPSTTRSAVYVRNLEVPSLEEQRAISAVLEALDDRIEMNKQMNKTLEAIAQALFKSWFVDFDPVKAKAEGQKPEGMDDATAALFSSAFTESILGPIPEGWAISEIGKEVEVVGGSTPSTQEASYWDNGRFYWATPKDLSKLQSPILLDTERKITDFGVKQISSGQLPVDTVLLSSRAPVGYIALAKIPVSINQGFIAMKCAKNLSPYYVINWIYHTLEEIKARATGTTFAEISKSVFRPIKVIVPNSSVIQSFNDIAKPMYDRIAENERGISSLINTRDLLLPRLISGKLRVSDLTKESTIL